MSTSKPRPFHNPMRDLRETPDDAEPSYSYEDSAFLGGRADDVEDEFHRRLTSSSTTKKGDFWRTELPALALEPVKVKERKSSGGLLGAALLQSQNSSLSDHNGNGSSHGISPTKNNNNNTTNKAATPTNGKNLDSNPNSHIQTTNGNNNTTQRMVAFHTPVSNGSTRDIYRRSGSSASQSSLGSAGGSAGRDAKKNISKQRAEARRLKMVSQLQEVDIGHVEVPDEHASEEFMDKRNRSGSFHDNDTHQTNTTRDGQESLASNDSSTDYGSTARSGGMFYSGKSTSSRSSGGTLFGKNASLIFPTYGDSGDNADAGESSSNNNLKRQKITTLIEQCDAVRFPFKKKLILASMNLTAAGIPIKELYGTNLGKTLHKLSLAGNRLSTLPPKLVTCLPVLKTLDLSQCELHQLPERWNLPQLRRLNLSHNRLTDFPEEAMLEGIPELQHLDMYGNKVSVIVVPHNPHLLSKLELLNLGYNDLAYIPDEMDQLKSLRTLKVMNNFLERIPMRVCDMELKTIDVSSNPVIQPPIETCERGICSMKRYYHCLRMEEQSKQKALEALQFKATTQAKKLKGKKMFNLAKPNRMMQQLSLGRKASDDSGSQAATVASVGSTVKAGGTKPLAAKEEKPPATRSVSLNVPTTPISTPPPPTKPRSKSAAYTLESNDESPTEQLKETLSAQVEEAKPASPPAAITEPSEEFKDHDIDDITVNDTLKVIFVGMAMAGKTSMIYRLMDGTEAKIPDRDERTIGVDIYDWDPKDDHRFEHIDSRIRLEDKELEMSCGDVNVKFSVWDFAGQHVYHATHQLFFSPRSLYVLVWDMGANNAATKVRKPAYESRRGPFSMNDSDDESDDDDFTMEEEVIRADRELKRDIDEKIQFWVDCIQSSTPGAAILPVATFDDYFASNPQEAKRRCKVLKERLLEHETRRIEGIKARLKEYEDQNRANDEGALRLRKLLCSYIRPKLIFGNTDDDAVVRVSGKNYTGFAKLTERIINIATGREKANMTHPIFRGHVGARIPRMRLDVRDVVRRMRSKFKVVEWGYFLNQLKESGLTNVEDISDALHFLTNVGELSYFGGVFPDRSDSMALMNDEFAKNSKQACMSLMGNVDDVSALSEDEDADDDDSVENAMLSVDNTSITLPTTDAGSISTFDETLNGGLSQYVFLNPRWLLGAVACILRHDLDREIQDTKRKLSNGHKPIQRGESFYETNLNCPVITAEDACMLWQAKKLTKKAVEKVEAYSNNMPVKPFEFLQLLLIRFGVFVPIDLGIEKAFLGGKEYARALSMDDDTPHAPEEITVMEENSVLNATFFFLPSLLGPGEPAEAWTYKSTDSWKATLCHSVLFPDGVPPGLMERITAAVLSNIYAISQRREQLTMRSIDGSNVATYEGQLTVKEVLCWRTAFFVKVGMKTHDENTESTVEVFCSLVDKESHLCVGSASMLSGMRRLVTSAKGQEGHGGRKIWKGGYLIVLKAVQKVMDEYGGLEYEKQGFCPECLAKKSVAEAGFWDFTLIRSAIKNEESIMRCRHGHRVDTRLVAGPLDNLKPKLEVPIDAPETPINSLLRGVVVVGLWDGKSRKVLRVGSGFIADRKRGLIVTASHTLMNIWGERSTPFGENYYGLRQGKVVIGVIPRQKGEEGGTEAVFRYFAKIVAKDPFIDRGVCHLDACVLKITTRMESDVSGNGEGCGDQPERLLLNNPIALKQERLHQLPITEKCELDEQVRIVGYNQGGEGLMGPGVDLNRFADFARGYVVKKFTAGEVATEGHQDRFKPREEIALICPTIGGHSGGPCVNLQGEVIGILSRADPADNQRCYLSPTYEWKALLKEAKKAL